MSTHESSQAGPDPLASSVTLAGQSPLIGGAAPGAYVTHAELDRIVEGIFQGFGEALAQRDRAFAELQGQHAAAVEKLIRLVGDQVESNEQANAAQIEIQERIRDHLEQQGLDESEHWKLGRPKQDDKGVA